GFTYSAHPVACAAALASLDIIEREDLCGHVKRIGPHFQRKFGELIDLPVVGDVRGMQLMVCVECVKDKKTKEPMPAEWDVGNRIIKDRKSTRLNSSHVKISYAVFCLKKKK